MWVDGQNFVGMTDRQMAEWSGGSICVGMTDGWMDGRTDCGFKVDGEEGVDGWSEVGYLVDKMDRYIYWSIYETPMEGPILHGPS